MGSDKPKEVKKILLGIAILLLMTSIGYCQEQSLQLTIKSDKQVYKIGETINIIQIIKNISDKDVYIDEQSTFRYPKIQTEVDKSFESISIGNAEIKPRGAEAFVKIEKTKTKGFSWEFPIKNRDWYGLYKGVALEYKHGTGISIVPLKDIPGKYNLSIVWSFSDYAKERGKKFGFQNCFTGKLVSNTIAIEIISASEDYLSYTIPGYAEEKEIELSPHDEKFTYSKRVEYWFNTEKVGERTFWKNGKLHYECPFKDSKRHGALRVWDTDGNLTSISYFRNGKQYGWSRSYYDNGQVKAEGFLKNGIQHGIFKQWNREGKLLGTFQFNMGTGIAKSWHDNGNLKSEICIRNGKLHGVRKHWDEDGRFLEKDNLFYINGKEVSKSAYLKAVEADPTLPKYQD
ncbi:MAG: toxin-antitoxin system YwqK family antitoxin [Candidatus Omnitrophota bacterium]|nr:MAG: toxin-antitoxin system YwqK family antitoxin [Candidatus Omnitrophota bacterium]